MKQFTANIPARKANGQTKVFTYPAHDDTYTCDDSGLWTVDMGFGPEKIREEDVIDNCQSATNWQEIRTKYFPMVGFHS